MNRLASATSPYLLQHADNPVDWWPWSDEAFAEARRRDVPVLLSVGYAACHWCHVMAHESFEDPGTAALLNEHMVAIKVDREERPDVDSVYMTATQAMTGSGGWPMTVVMTPGREPVFCGTYLPRERFQQLIMGVAKAWQEQRQGVLEQGASISRALAANAAAIAKALRDDRSSEWPAIADQAVVALRGGYDEEHGGFGGAPKFPPSMVLEFLLRNYERTASADALAMAAGTLEAMARGGMYDQLGGGFARYSVDATWTVPHFEKMLYDNALLARAYAHHYRRSEAVLSRRVAEETCDFLVRELRTPQGGFAASLDADSAGTEGAFYVWRPDELTSVLGPEDGQYAAELFGATAEGTFEHGSSVLQLPADPADMARYARVRSALFAARAGRERPGRDDKVVAAWNGLAISALAETGLLLGRPDLISAASDAARLLESVHVGDDAGGAGSAGGGQHLVRTSRDGVAGDSDGALEDYACVAEGLVTLSGVTGSPRWLSLAGELLDFALDSFADEAGGFYDAPADGEQLIFRPADAADNATPSGVFALAGALLSYAAVTGSARHRTAAEDALGVLPGIAARFPRAAGAGLAVAEALIAGPAEIAVVGPESDPRTAELHQTALRYASPGAVLAIGPGPVESIPLLAGRGLVDGAPAAYVCRQFVCQAPVTSPDRLRDLLASR
ncbi:MAG TPA: thioredoxin domain-containing protein [Streptosporangiaceae bacterium]|nr:thioredoxin domain-containing protein [Streptosporangiaceae bacterium]